jgi:uncharacterized protein
MTDYQKIIDKYYPEGTAVRDIYMRHARSVTDEALAIVRRKHLPLDESEVEAAAMLHDIGICRTDAAGIHCHGTEPYLAHGVIGAALLRSEGVDEAIAAVAERHTGAGLTAQEVAASGLPIPAGDYCPRTMLERLVCYADKFWSKSGDMERKPLAKVRASMAKWGESTVARFEDLHKQFGECE